MIKAKTIKQMHPIWLALSGVATIGILYGIYVLITKEKKQIESDFSQAPSGFCKYSGFPLKYGSCGNEVIALQKYLNSKTRTPRVLLKVDGKFGNSTKESLLRIEKISSVSKAQFAQLKMQLNPFL